MQQVQKVWFFLTDYWQKVTKWSFISVITVYCVADGDEDQENFRRGIICPHHFRGREELLWTVWTGETQHSTTLQRSRGGGIAFYFWLFHFPLLFFVIEMRFKIGSFVVANILQSGKISADRRKVALVPSPIASKYISDSSYTSLRNKHTQL